MLNSNQTGTVLVFVIVGAATANYLHHGSLGYLQDCGFVPAVGALAGASLAMIGIGLFGKFEGGDGPPDDFGGAT